ncbi:MAG: glycosyltransferase [Bryobacterales bacterium]|nr:glycosyltransferase [Bryobacterales bacterium]
MKVSIIVSSYNYERYVAASIESALTQTHRDIEVVVVDDGSTDRSMDIIRQYQGRVTIVTKKNGGQASAFNLAYKHCTGDLVFFLDSDDLLFPEAVAKCVAAWMPGCSKVHFPLEIILDDSTRTGALVPRAALPAGEVLPELLREGMYVSPPNSGNAFSRGFLDKVMPIPEAEWAYGPDGYLVFLAPFYGSIAAVQQPLGLYRRHIQSVTNITAAGTVEMVKKLNHMVQSFVELRKQLEHFAARHGRSLGANAVFTHWLCLKVRLALARVAPELDPWGPASSGKLFRHMVNAIWRTGDLRLVERIEYLVWAALVSLLPRSGALFLTKLAFAPGERKQLLRRAVGLAA